MSEVTAVRAPRIGQPVARSPTKTDRCGRTLDREELTGQPGTRVPHVRLERTAEQISTLDLLDGAFVLSASTPSAASGT